MEKTTVAPKIVVYHNALKNVQKILELAKDSQSIYERHGVVEGVKPWGYYGTIVQVKNYNHDILDNESEEDKNQKKLINSIYDAYHEVVTDYLKEYLNAGDWQDYIDESHIPQANEYKNNSLWNASWLSFLTYTKREYETENINRSAGDRRRLTMEFHTDYDDKYSDLPASKPFITVTAYLNDDYEGGEICFIDEVTGKLYSYKAKPGDITVFPSSAPYWHGVLPSYGTERYLVRAFLMYNYAGSKEILEQYGEQPHEFWENLAKERYKKFQETEDPKKMLTIVFMPGEEVNIKPEDYRKVIVIKEGPIKVGEK